MARVGFVRRHKVAIASNCALLVAAVAVVGYAVAADGYQSHEAELNDGGIWVVYGDRGINGRMNKPINQLDAIVYSENGSERDLDIVQEGAAIAAIDRTAGTAQVIDPSNSTFDATAKISLPAEGDQQMAGGTFASLDAETGALWAVRLDPLRGKPLISTADSQAKPRVTVGDDAALTVTPSGTVVATSADEGTVTYLVPDGDLLTKPREEALPEAAGSPTAVTAVGETIVTLDGADGQLAVIGGPTATVPQGSVLQQAGPDASAVLVATPDSLLSVDLDSGTASVIGEGGGTPIEPVRLGACSYAAWSGGLGEVSVQCGSDEAVASTLGGKASNLAFRVNRGEIVLNDNSSGTVWNLDDQDPEQIDNWNAFTRSKQVKDKDEQDQQQNSGDRTPPEAKADNYGARPGRVTVLHPLDNDSAPQGRLLSIVNVEQPTGGSSAEISPDGQTIVLSMPADARSTAFEYFIDDGRSNFSASATISVDVRGTEENAQPSLREGYEPRRWRTPAAGSVTIPVLADWRDDADGDALVLESAAVVGAANSGAAARTTSDGRVRFTGSRDGGDTYQVEYFVSDGRSESVRQTLMFDVQDKRDRETFPAIAEPDVVRGEVGQPVKIRPLLNDLPGSDPGDPDAELLLGGKIPAQPGAAIQTDVETGVITFTADRPDTYFIEYDAAFGKARLDSETVRIDVRPRPNQPGDPIAMPDNLTLFGQGAGVIDVLANDLDPAGGLLVVQRAIADNANQLDVAIIDGRWLRIAARRAELGPNPQVVRYTISNGANSGVQGEVTVSQRPAPADNSPVTTADRVHVRSGASVTVPVLDNDLSPSGDRLTLVGDAAFDVPGELEVDRVVGVKTDVGRAFVSGRNVRYIAPDLEEQDSFDVRYVARSSTGETAGGKLTVVVTPTDEPNTAPEPPTLEGRVVWGGTIKVRLPGTGIDAEGDPVTISGITSAPSLGRISSYGGNFLEYQAYPRTSGTDEFEYSVVDTRGAIATGVVRIAVVPNDEGQPPLAVADQLTVEPGRTAVFDPVANDYVASGDEVEISLVDAPEGAEIDLDTNLVSVPAAASVDDPAVTVVYQISNGVESSISTLRVDTALDFKNPPVIFDAFGQADDSARVAVDVLEGAYDPDGRVADLKVVEVYAPEGSASINGSTIRVDRGQDPIVVPFRVEDADGAMAMASLYVPPTGTAIPYVRPDAEIEVDEGGTMEGSIGDYIVNPSGGPLRLTGRNSVSASPLEIQPQRIDDQTFQITARNGYRGPGALLLEVTTATDEAGNEDPEDPTDGYTALLSIPVQVGEDTPVLNCPQGVIDMTAGQVLDLDIPSFCNVWTLDPSEAGSLPYEGAWTTSVDGLSVSGNGGQVLTVTAADNPGEGGEATLSISTGDSEPAEVRFLLDGENAPPPSMLPIRGEELDAGQSRNLDLARYLEPGVADPVPTVVSIDLINGAGVSASTNGGSGITLRANNEAAGRAVFRVVMSDVADSSSPDRRAEGTLEVQLAGLPGEPSPPFVTPSAEEKSIRLEWAAPRDDGGSPITGYVVRDERTKAERQCRTTVCDINGLQQRRNYNFRVAAVNKVGQGPWSDLSLTAFADTPPARVTGIRMLSRGDHTITIGWAKPQSSTTIQQYRVSWLGQSTLVPGTQTSWTISGLDNNKKYVFSVEAENSVNWSPRRDSPPFQPLGTPAPPNGLTVADLESGGQNTSVRTSWTATLPEGPGPTLYSVNFSKDGGPVTPVPGCARIQATTCTHAGVPYDGARISYTVHAHNIENSSAASAPVTFEAVGRPANWGPVSVTPTGVDGQARVSGTAPESRGKEAIAAIIVGGGVVWENRVAPGVIINELVQTGSNEAVFPVVMRMCNESAARVGCSTSDQQLVQTYGPLRPEHINDPTPLSVNGLEVTWIISGTSNGNAAKVEISVDGVSRGVVSLGAPGAFQISRTYKASDYKTETAIEARLFDDDPQGRGQAPGYGQVTSGDPPLPTVTLYKAASCSNGCSMDPPCVVSSCGTLGITVAGAYGTDKFSCRVTASNDPWVRGRQDNMTNGNTVTNWVFDNGTVGVQCERGGTYPFTVDASFQWPTS